MSALRGRRADALYLLGTFLGAALATLWLFRAHWATLDEGLIGYSLDALHHLRVYRWHWKALAALDPAGLVDAPTMLPLPHGLAYGDNMLALSLAGWPLALGGREVLAANFVVLVSFPLCAVCCAAFVRALTGSAPAGIFAGIAWAFHPMRMEHVVEANNLWMMWCPLAFWAFVRWRETRGWGWAALGGAAIYLQFLSTIQILFHLLLALLLWGLGTWAARGFRLSRRVLVQVAAVGAAEAVLVAPWVPVYLVVLRHSVERRSEGIMAKFSADLAGYASTYSPGPVVWALVAVACGGLALRLLRSRNAGPRRANGVGDLLSLLGLSALMIVLSLGPYLSDGERFTPLPFHYLTKIAPVYDAVRTPVRMCRLAALLLAGVSAWGFLAMLGWILRTIARSRVGTHVSRGVVTAATTAAVVLVTVSTSEPIRPDRLVPPGDELAQPFLELPDDAVLFPIPFYGAASHAVHDFLQTRHGRGLVGGYQSSIPPLFLELRNATDVFPQEGALEAIEATGATHVVIRKDAIAPVQLELLEQPLRSGRLVHVHDDPTWRILKLERTGLRVFDPFDPGSSLSLRGPSAVAPGQPVTLALVPEVGRTRVDLSPRRPARIVVTRGAQTVSRETVVCWSPHVVAPGGRPYQVTFAAPTEPGAYVARLEWEGSSRFPTCPFEVRAGLSTTFDRAPGPYALTELARPSSLHRQSVWPLTIRLRNESEVVWLARSDAEIPPSRGETMWAVRYDRSDDPPGGRASESEFIMTQERHHYLLPHDLSPGDEVVTSIVMRAPRRPGSYGMEIDVRALYAKPWEGIPVKLDPITVR